jgi:ribosome-binding factor A
MINNQKTKEIKTLKREAMILKTLLAILPKIGIKSSLLLQISFTKVTLSAEKSNAFVYVFSAFGKEIAEAAIKLLVSYQKQIHASLCSELQFRYMPKLKFMYDGQYEKIIKINDLIELANKNNME